MRCFSRGQVLSASNVAESKGLPPILFVVCRGSNPGFAVALRLFGPRVAPGLAQFPWAACEAGLSGRLHAVHKGLEARVGPQRVEVGIVLEPFFLAHS